MDEVTSSTLLKKGAEARLYLASWHDRQVVIKMRLPKKYRPAKLDLEIRSYRTVHEPQLMHEAKKAGVPTPTIFLVDVKNAVIMMEFVEGKQVKQLLGNISKEERQELCVKIGELIGKLHGHGVIHGDLTTSNMILNAEGKIFLVDFGLGEKNDGAGSQRSGFALDETRFAEYALPVCGRMLRKRDEGLHGGFRRGRDGKGFRENQGDRKAWSVCGREKRGSLA